MRASSAAKTDIEYRLYFNRHIGKTLNSQPCERSSTHTLRVLMVCDRSIGDQGKDILLLSYTMKHTLERFDQNTDAL